MGAALSGCSDPAQAESAPTNDGGYDVTMVRTASKGCTDDQIKTDTFGFVVAGGSVKAVNWSKPVCAPSGSINEAGSFTASCVDSTARITLTGAVTKATPSGTSSKGTLTGTVNILFYDSACEATFSISSK